MNKLCTKISMLLLLVIASGVVGCSGGNSGSTPTTTVPQTVSGVAAAGSPISGTVYLKDSSSPAKEIATTIGADGSFSFDATGLTAPFLFKAVGTANGRNYTLYSVADGPGTANINPLSHLAVVQANGGADPALLYAGPTRAELEAIKTALATVIPQIQALLQQILTPYGVASTNFITDAYTANHLGLDLLFDMVSIAVNNGNLLVSNNVNGATILSFTLGGSTMTGQIITANIPAITTQSAGAVYVYPATTAVALGGTTTFKAIVMGTTKQTVSWSVVESGGGSITSAGVYTAPATAGTYHVQATSTADSSKSFTAAVVVGTGGNSAAGGFTTAMISGKKFSSLEYNTVSNGIAQQDAIGTLTFNADGTIATIAGDGTTTTGTWQINGAGQVVITVSSLGTSTLTLVSATATTLVATVSWSYTGSVGTSTLLLTAM